MTDLYPDLTQQYEAVRQLQAELSRRMRQAQNRAFMLAWAQMMHGAPPCLLLGNGVWFNNNYQPLITEVPFRG